MGPFGKYCIAPPGAAGNFCNESDDCGVGGRRGKPQFRPMSPIAATNSCTHYVEVDVPLKLSGGIYKAGKGKISTKTSASPDLSGKGRIDADNLKLLCNP